MEARAARSPAGEAYERPHGPSPAQLVDRQGRCRLAFEPIADLARGTICGYEAVERFPGALTPEAWRGEALRRGLEPDLDAFVVASMLAARESLPANCFLSFNVAPSTLLREPVQRLLRRVRRLDGLVVELSPRVARRDEGRLAAAVAALREAGATLAVDHVGGDDGVLRHVGIVRPEFVKLGPELIAGIHRDDARRTLLEGIGRLASSFNAWIVAQGVEQIQELDALLRMRVPLAQGPLIGVPTKTLTPVAFALSAYVRERGAAMREPGAVAALVEHVAPLERDGDRDAAAAAFSDDPELRWIPTVDARRRPVGLFERSATERGAPPDDRLLAVTPSSPLAAVAQRAMLRPHATRFHPLVCCDERGRYLGLVSIDRIVAALAATVDGGG